MKVLSGDMKMRNPTLTLGNKVIQFIGDTHLAQRFVNNVRLERRGDYEEIQYAEFERLLATSADYHIQVGDLFHSFHVDEADLLKTYLILKDFKGKQLFILQGNHDAVRSLTEVSSFEILAEMIQGLPNVTIVRSVKSINLAGQRLAMVGWEFDKTLVQKLPARTDIVVCHMDSVSYGDEGNVIPFEALAEAGVTMVLNGHEHKPSSKRIAGIEYIGVGSLLPYSHAEDDGDGIYVSFFSVDSLELEMGNLKDCHVRVYTDTPELIPEFQSLSLQVNKAKKPDEDEVQPEHVEVEEWSLDHLGQLSGERVGLDAVKVRSVLNEILEADNA